jgi:hypothetical protein
MQTGTWRNLLEAALAEPDDIRAQSALAGLARFATGATAMADRLQRLPVERASDPNIWPSVVALARIVRILREPARAVALADMLAVIRTHAAIDPTAVRFRESLLVAESAAASPDDRRRALSDLAAMPVSDAESRAEVALSSMFSALLPGPAGVDWAGALAAVGAAEGALARVDASWDGERVAVATARAFVVMQGQRQALGPGAPASAQEPATRDTETALVAALALIAGQGAREDEAQLLTGLVPLWLATGRTTLAVERLESWVKQLPDGRVTAASELRMRHLLTRAYAAARRFGPALTALYAALDRCRALDALPMLLVFMADAPVYYLEAGLPDEAIAFARLVRSGFEQRTDAHRAELLEFSDQLLAEVEARAARGPR